MVRMLHAGRIDAIILPYSLAVYSSRQEKLDPDSLQFGETLTEFDVSIAMSKASDPALVGRLKTAFRTLQSDNSLANILSRYGLGPRSDPTPTD